jgi:hypothetical protein
MILSCIVLEDGTSPSSMLPPESLARFKSLMGKTLGCDSLMAINTDTNAHSRCAMGTCRSDLDSVRMLSALRDDLEFKSMNFEIRHDYLAGYDTLAGDDGERPCELGKTLTLSPAEAF